MPDTLDLTPIRARLEAAAPHLDGCEIQAVRRDPASDWVPVRDLVRHAPDDLRYLLAEVERLQEALAALEDRPPEAALIDALTGEIAVWHARFAEGLRENADGSYSLLWTAEELERAATKAAAWCEVLGITPGDTRESLAAVNRELCERIAQAADIERGYQDTIRELAERVLHHQDRAEKAECALSEAQAQERARIVADARATALLVNPGARGVLEAWASRIESDAHIQPCEETPFQPEATDHA